MIPVSPTCKYGCLFYMLDLEVIAMINEVDHSKLIELLGFSSYYDWIIDSLDGFLILIEPGVELVFRDFIIFFFSSGLP